MSSIFYCTLKNNVKYNCHYISNYAFKLKRGLGPSIINPTDIKALKESLEMIACKNQLNRPIQPFINNSVTCIIDSNGFIHPQSIIDLILTYGIPNFTKYINDYYTILVKYSGCVYIFRDPSGFKPLYVGFNKTNDIVTITSEIKAIPKISGTTVYTFPAGYYWSKSSHSFFKLPKQYSSLGGSSLGGSSNLLYSKNLSIPNKVHNVCLINGDIPSLVLYYMYRGLEGTSFCSLNYTSEDLSPNPNIEYSKIMAYKLGFDLDVITFNIQDIVKNIENIIVCLETCDVSAIQMAIPIYILMSKISSKGSVFISTTHGWSEVTSRGCDEDSGKQRVYLVLDKVCGYFNVMPKFNFNGESILPDLETIKQTKINDKKIEKMLYQIVGRTPQDYSEDWIKELVKYVGNNEGGKSLSDYYRCIYDKNFSIFERK